MTMAALTPFGSSTSAMAPGGDWTKRRSPAEPKKRALAAPAAAQHALQRTRTAAGRCCWRERLCSAVRAAERGVGPRGDNCVQPSLNLIVLRVADLERAQRFYEALGLR